MSFTLISRSVLQRLNLYYSLFSLSNSSHSSTLLYFYFPFYPSPLILLKSEPFIFLFSCFIVQWIACSPFLIPFGYHVCLLFARSLSLSPSLSLTAPWSSMRRSWQKLPPTVTVARPTRNPGCQEWVKSRQSRYYSKLSLPLFFLTPPRAPLHHSYIRMERWNQPGEQASTSVWKQHAHLEIFKLLDPTSNECTAMLLTLWGSV